MAARLRDAVDDSRRLIDGNKNGMTAAVRVMRDASDQTKTILHRLCGDLQNLD
jgi:hypothetical protein